MAFRSKMCEETPTGTRLRSVRELLKHFGRPGGASLPACGRPTAKGENACRSAHITPDCREPESGCWRGRGFPRSRLLHASFGVEQRDRTIAALGAPLRVGDRVLKVHKPQRVRKRFPIPGEGVGFAIGTRTESKNHHGAAFRSQIDATQRLYFESRLLARLACRPARNPPPVSR